jgi:hypothetical protein
MFGPLAVANDHWVTICTDSSRAGNCHRVGAHHEPQTRASLRRLVVPLRGTPALLCVHFHGAGTCTSKRCTKPKRAANIGTPRLKRAAAAQTSGSRSTQAKLTHLSSWHVAALEQSLFKAVSSCSTVAQCEDSRITTARLAAPDQQ